MRNFSYRFLSVLSVLLFPQYVRATEEWTDPARKLTWVYLGEYTYQEALEACRNVGPGWSLPALTTVPTESRDPVTGFPIYDFTGKTRNSRLYSEFGKSFVDLATRSPLANKIKYFSEQVESMHPEQKIFWIRDAYGYLLGQEILRSTERMLEQLEAEGKYEEERIRQLREVRQALATWPSLKPAAFLLRNLDPKTLKPVFDWHWQIPRQNQKLSTACFKSN